MEEKAIKKIKIWLIILFILSIISLGIGLLLWELIVQKTNTSLILDTKYMWLFYCFLPIPILSLILGIVYSKKGISCKKNIIIGIIMSLFLIGYGSFSSTFAYGRQYTKTYKFEKIIGINLPKNGEYRYIEWNYDKLVRHATHYIKFSYTSENSVFNKEIKESNNWLLKEKLNDQLQELIPPTLVCHDEHICYYSIYNKTLNTYNRYPDINEENDLYVMLYDYKNFYLQIDNFILSN